MRTSYSKFMLFKVERIIKCRTQRIFELNNTVVFHISHVIIYIHVHLHIENNNQETSLARKFKKSRPLHWTAVTISGKLNGSSQNSDELKGL